MVEIDSTKEEFVISLVFSLVDAGHIPYGFDFDKIDKAIEVASKSFEDVTYMEFNKKIVIQD